jgi:hypothetical protein
VGTHPPGRRLGAAPHSNSPHREHAQGWPPIARELRRSALRSSLPLLLLLGLVGAALWQLLGDEAGIVTEELTVGETPVRIYRPAGAQPAPLVLVAHGFAGSRRLMEPVALALAGRGYVAATFDFLGHGAHPRPLRGALQDQAGTPALLVRQTHRVVEGLQGRAGGTGRLAVVGHSMATNILVRFAQERADVAATVAISMFAPTVDPTSPANLLVIPGAWEGRLVAEGRRAVAMVADTAPEGVQPFTTYGSREAGTARRLAVAPHVEHIGVLYSATTLEETVGWIDAAFGRGDSAGSEGGTGAGRAPAAPSDRDGVRARGRGLWILMLMVSVFALARPLAARLPRCVGPGEPPGGAGAGWRRLWLVGGLPALLTPLLLRFVPTGFLPVVVADYLALHFLAYGLFTAGLLWWTGGRPGLAKMARRAGLSRTHGTGVEGTRPGPHPRAPAIAAGGALMVLFFVVLVAWPLDRFFTAFFPVPARLPVLLAILVGTLPYFVADEWLTRGAQAQRGAYPFTKALFLASLVVAVALDFQGLFFLVLIVPVMLAFFVVHGLFSRWAYRATGSPLVAGLANAVAFAWAIAVTFPLYAGG